MSDAEIITILVNARNAETCNKLQCCADSRVFFLLCHPPFLLDGVIGYFERNRLGKKKHKQTWVPKQGTLKECNCDGRTGGTQTAVRARMCVCVCVCVRNSAKRKSIRHVCQESKT